MSNTAPLRSRYLKALAPAASQQDNFGHFYVDGALQLHVALNFINMAGRTMQGGDRNLNTGHRPGMDAEMRVAHQTVYHDAWHPSHLTLPVVPPVVKGRMREVDAAKVTRSIPTARHLTAGRAEPIIETPPCDPGSTEPAGPAHDACWRRRCHCIR